MKPLVGAFGRQGHCSAPFARSQHTCILADWPYKAVAQRAAGSNAIIRLSGRMSSNEPCAPTEGPARLPAPPEGRWWGEAVRERDNYRAGTPLSSQTYPHIGHFLTHLKTNKCSASRPPSPQPSGRKCYGLVSKYVVRFEVFTAVTMKNVVFWDINTVRTSQETYYVYATELSRLMQCKI
jgi:hypothetical protein